MKKVTLIILSFFIFTFQNTEAQTVDEILANYFENTGGLENWKNLESTKSTGKFLQQGMEFPFTSMRKAPNMFKTVADVQGKTIIPQAYDGETAWSLNPFAMQTEPTAMPEEEQKEIALEAEFEDSFINYKEKGYKVELEGTETIEGTECFKVKLTKKEDNVSYYFFDTENFVPIMTRTFIKTGPYKGQESESYMSDYDEAGGFIMPYSIVQKVAGQTVATIKVENFEINPEIDDSEFAFKK